MAVEPESNLEFSFDPRSISFDAEAFDDLIRSQGVQYVHWRSMKCPVGMTDRYSERRVHEDHSGCSNGHIYTRAGLVTGSFIGNDSKWNQNETGLLDASSVQGTLPRTYDDTGEDIVVAPFDRFYLTNASITVPHTQLVEAHVTGRDKLSFPAVAVYDIVDATGRRYQKGDFTIDPQTGQIVWVRGPSIDPILQKGVVYSIRYTYRPYYYVERVAHQVRVAQVETDDGREVMRMSQMVTLQREYVAEKEDRDDRAPDPKSQRQVKSPGDGVFGPR